MRPLLGTMTCVLVCIGCYSGGSTSGGKSQAMKSTPTESDACKAILRDLKISIDSPLGKALSAEKFVREEHSGDCIIETPREQLSFNLRRMEFKIVRGIDPKTDAPHEIRGKLFISHSGRLEASFAGEK